MESIIYDPELIELSQALELHERGVRLLCPVCHDELLIIDTKKLSAQHQKSQGIYCQNNEQHYYARFVMENERAEFWRKFEELRELRRQRDSPS
jgi:hypothetical protein